MIIDYLTGVTQAYMNRKLKSRTAINGALRKLGYLALVAVSYPIEDIIQLPAVTLITTSIIIGEIISVIENVAKMGIEMPTILNKLVERLEDKNNEKK